MGGACRRIPSAEGEGGVSEGRGGNERRRGSVERLKVEAGCRLEILFMYTSSAGWGCKGRLGNIGTGLARRLEWKN